jgi:beta-1,4-mannooligosaccharide/beta-1,4-mannosyl-N-acetylglucosamine phosphorylase
MMRYEKNPVLTRKDIPAIAPKLVDVSSVFNPGAVRMDDQYYLMLRVQNRARETFFVPAISQDGLRFRVSNRIVHFKGIEYIREPIFHNYDARLTKIDDICYVMFAMDMSDGCRLGIAQTNDFETFRFLGITTGDDVRNGVLFPRKFDGKYLRLDRPNRVPLEGGPVSGSEIWLSESTDLIHWKPVQSLIQGRFHYWDELIGAGPPPIKTTEGWLCIYHGVATHFGSANIYQAGVFLLDLDDPSKVIARGKYNILEPRENYELIGQVPNVVFPSGAIVRNVDRDDCALPNSEVLIYYGAADTAVGVCVATIRELLDAALAQ